jgi:hypothetical protein
MEMANPPLVWRVVDTGLSHKQIQQQFDVELQNHNLKLINCVSCMRQQLATPFDAQNAPRWIRSCDCAFVWPKWTRAEVRHVSSSHEVPLGGTKVVPNEAKPLVLKKKLREETR